MEHDYLPCRTLDEENKASVLDVGHAGYGPDMGDQWPSIDIDTFNSSYHPKCAHAIDYFEKNNITFFCHECKKWLCLECLNDHLAHGLMLHVGFNNANELREIDPNLYNSENQLLLVTKAFETDNNKIKVEFEITNPNNVSLYDLRLMCTWDGLEERDNVEKIDNKYFLCKTLTELEVIPPEKTMKGFYEIPDGVNLHLSSIITLVRFKDVFLGKGRVLKESLINNSK